MKHTIGSPIAPSPQNLVFFFPFQVAFYFFDNIIWASSTVTVIHSSTGFRVDNNWICRGQWNKEIMLLLKSYIGFMVWNSVWGLDIMWANCQKGLYLSTSPPQLTSSYLKWCPVEAEMYDIIEHNDDWHLNTITIQCYGHWSIQFQINKCPSIGYLHSPTWSSRRTLPVLVVHFHFLALGMANCWHCCLCSGR